MAEIIKNEQIVNSIRRTVANRKRLAARVQDPTTRRLLDIEEEAQSNEVPPEFELGPERTF